ncbi:hypothetical protein GS462_26840 [Rhodococcus hoagii]|nr:hypothetical protein [Prescottella equi]
MKVAEADVVVPALVVVVVVVDAAVRVSTYESVGRYAAAVSVVRAILTADPIGASCAIRSFCA